MELIEYFKEAEENSIRFSEIGQYPDSIGFSRLNQFYHWYYFPNVEVFAPSKFIGYKDTSLNTYSGEGTGTETQRKLSKWFHKLDKNSTVYADLENRLRKFLFKHGHTLSKKTTDGTGGIYIPNNQYALTRFPDQVTDENYPEGSVTTVIVNVYERNPKARQACIAHYGCSCFVCNVNFEKRYGQLGHGFIHVHHLKELSTIGQEYSIDPIKDLRPICPNCHAMVHMDKPAVLPEDLKSKYLQ